MLMMEVALVVGKEPQPFINNCDSIKSHTVYFFVFSLKKKGCNIHDPYLSNSLVTDRHETHTINGYRRAAILLSSQDKIGHYDLPRVLHSVMYKLPAE